MHPALQVAEILQNIFSHWQAPCCDILDHPPRIFHDPESLKPRDLAVLARTCRVFKEPALDVLWSALDDLTPLACCLSEVCYEMFPGEHETKAYGFHRPLEQTEWDILRSYTSRIRSIHNFGSAVCFLYIGTFLRPPRPSSDLLFPNLRHFHYLYYNAEASPLLSQTLPSLISVKYTLQSGPYEDWYLFDHLEPFPGHSPKLGQLTMDMRKPVVEIDPVVSSFICRWPNPRIVSCPLVTLSVDAFKHLSRVSDLTQLSFMLDATFPDRVTRLDALCFIRLHKLELRSKSLIPASNLLAHIQLPALTDLSVTFEDIPTKQNVASFLGVLQTSDICNSVTTLTLTQSGRRLLGNSIHSPRSYDVLVGDDLRPLMALKNLRHLDFNLKWSVGLTDDDLVELVSAWPHLEHLLVNQLWGWRQISGGITANGITRLLQTCRSLSHLALAVDARSSFNTQLHPVSRSLSIDILDSTIEVASVPTMIVFFAVLTVLMSGTLTLNSWNPSKWYSNSLVQVDDFERWEVVFAQRRKVLSTIAGIGM